jgi:hypothetical protein
MISRIHERIRIYKWIDNQFLITIVLVSLLLVSLVFVSTPRTTSFDGFDFDGRYYASMAGEVSLPSQLAHHAPWCFRILTPYLASLLPFDSLTSFQILAFGSNVLSLVLVALILQALDCPPASRLFGVLLYAGSFWVLRFSFYAPAYIDYQTNLLLLLIIYLTLLRWYNFLPIVFIVAALQKESLVVYSIFSIVHILRYSKLSRAQPWIISLLTISLPFIALLVVRRMITADNVYDYSIILVFINTMIDPHYWPVLLQALFSCLGVIPLLLIISYQAWPSFLRRHWEWVIFAGISLVSLVGGGDKARLFLYTLPLGVILATFNLEVFRRMTTTLRFAVWIAVVLLVHWWIGNYLSPVGTVEQYLNRMVPEHSDGQFVPYLITNIVVSLALLLFTIPMIFGGLRFRPGVGFTRPEEGPMNEQY